ncbi:MAG: hypothetical protein ACTSRR_12820, partial [Candidatus Heimdallarchaeaceae archaeon]
MKFQKHIIITINFLLILQSLLYIQNISNSQKDRQNITQIIPGNIEDNQQESIYHSDVSSTNVHTTLTQGTNKTFGFFTQDSYVNLDSDGNVFQWEKYDVVKDTGDNSVYADFAMDYSYSYTWPSSPNSYVPLIDIETGTQLASTFSPPFSETTYLSGKVYFLTYISTYVSSFTITLTLRIRLWLYNPNDGGLTEILTIESVLPDNSDLTQRVYSSTLEDKVTIPSGYRLKVTYEAKTSRIDRAAYVHLETGEYSDGDQVNWQINDAEYSNTYTLNDVTSALGVQLYMYDETYPTISISGAENNTIYYDTNEITISTSGAVSNSYKWDSNSYTAFDPPVNTTLPSSTGWHYLYIQALDEYDNKNEVVYKIGYESSSIVLHNANNNSLVPNNFLLNFSLSGYDSAQYAWDSGGNYTFSDPYDISVPDFSGEHTLYIYTVSSFRENKTVYVFEVDNSPPLISLRDLSNDTTQPTNKKIELNITDQTSTIEVLYNWDNAANSTWSPLEGTIYQTFAPDTDGFHWLNVYANDSFGHIIDVHYRFNISSDYLLVELRTMVNDSYYYGGNTVEVTITGTNGTIKYQWDSNGFKDGVTVDSILSLSGSESLPKDLGVHYLTIIVGDVDDNPNSTLFKFTIDQENPVVSNFGNYNNSRLHSSTIIDLEIADNFTLSSEIEAWVSIDGGGNISFTYPYDIEISSLEDGVHNITVFAFDIARNNVSCLIIFEIDTTAPEIDIVSIQGLEVSSSGVSYIPGNAAIECSFVDADPEIYHFYSWNNSAFTLFAGNTFNLPDTDGNATLRILANDTLGNEKILTLDLFIDTTPPQLSILFPNNYSKINEATPLLFFANDSASDTISSISAKWDQFLEGEIDLSPPYFTLYLSSLKKLYEELSVAELYIDAKDILGNNFTYIYSFNL